MKKFYFLMAMLCVSTLGFAAEPKVTFDFTENALEPQLPTSSSDKLKDATTYKQGGYEIVIQANATSDAGFYYGFGGLMIGKKDATITLPKFDFAVSSIKLEGVSGGSKNVGINIFAGEAEASTATTGLDDETSQTYEIADEYQTAGTQLQIKITTAHNARIAKILIFEKAANAPEKPVFSKEAGIYFEEIAVEITSATEGADIYYTTDGTTPTSASTKYEKAVVIGMDQEVTLTAVAIKDGVESTPASAKYSVVKLDGDGSQENPFSVADVLKLDTKIGTEEDKYWVIGYILTAANASIKKPTDEKDGNILLADAMTDKDTIACELSKAAIKKALNVKDNPENKGKQVKILGSLARQYLSKPGIREVEDYEFVEGEFKRPVYHAITIVNPEHGKISVKRNGEEVLKAPEGELVELSVTWEGDYILQEWKLTPAVEVSEAGSFVMPKEDVTITAVGRLAEKHKVVIEATENGTVTANPEEAIVGTIITLTITPAEGYLLDTVIVSDGTDKKITVAAGKFTMPDAEVKVKATFKEDPDKKDDALESVEVSLDLNAPMYNLLGQPVDETYKGVVIQNRKKFIRR